MLLNPQRPIGIDLRDVLPKGRFLGGDIRFTSCASDWHECQPGDLYVAMIDDEDDGHYHAQKAVENGARAVLCERLLPLQVPMCLVKDTRAAFGNVCQALAGNPTEQMATIGVTGTCGKTVTSMLLTSVLENSRQQVGLISSLGYSDGLKIKAARDTTPSQMEMASWLRQMAVSGCGSAVVEMSSRGLAQRKTTGIGLDAAVLTNIRRDHLDLHGSVKNYRTAKRRIFDHLKPGGFAVLNADDAASQELQHELNCPTITVGLHSHAELTATIVEQHRSEQTFLLHAGNETIPVRTSMIGEHHIYNCLAAAAVGLVMGMDLTAIVRGLEEVDYVPGRMERIECGQPYGVFVDCARTPDALAACLKAARKVTRGRVICAFGAEATLPPEMRAWLGRVAEHGADLPIITSNNPRHEPPLEIIHDVLDGFDRVAKAHVMPNRRNAVQWALEQARPGDSIILAGKGEMATELIGSRPQPHDDRVIARNWLQQQSATAPAPAPALSVYPPHA